MHRTGTLTTAEAARAVLSALEAGEDVVSFIIIDHPQPDAIGGRLLWVGDRGVGSLHDPRGDERIASLARGEIAGETEGTGHLLKIPLSTGDEATLYKEVHRPPSEMVIVGAGHLAQPLCTLGSLLGLQVVVLDDRPEFATLERFPEAREVREVDFARPFQEVALHPWSHVVLVTRGHRYDFECLRSVLQNDPLPRYVGMIGSRRRVRATFEALLDEGFSREVLARVRAPIGLDLGAETPGEIAISVAAEIVHFWRGGSGRPLQEVERILARHFQESGEEPQADIGGETQSGDRRAPRQGKKP